jgi:hypothetical protein
MSFLCCRTRGRNRILALVKIEAYSIKPKDGWEPILLYFSKSIVYCIVLAIYRYVDDRLSLSR